MVVQGFCNCLPEKSGFFFLNKRCPEQLRNRILYNDILFTLIQILKFYKFLSLKYLLFPVKSRRCPKRLWAMHEIGQAA